MVMLVIWDAIAPLWRHRNDFSAFSCKTISKGICMLNKPLWFYSHRVTHSPTSGKIQRTPSDIYVEMAIWPIGMCWRAFPKGSRHISLRLYVCENTRRTSDILFWHANWRQTFFTKPTMWRITNDATQSKSALQWRHNGHDSVSNHLPRECLLNSLFRCRSKKTSKLRVTGLCAGNSPETIPRTNGL